MNVTDGDAVAPLPLLGAADPTLQAIVASAQHGGTPLMLLHVDLDHFRSVNENMGEVVGDAVLAIVGQRLQRLAGPGAVVWGRGSAEFLLAVPRSPTALGPEEFGDFLCEQLQTPLTVLPYTLVLSATIGIALCPQHATDPDTLLRCAASAVEQAKNAGVNLVRVYQRNTSVTRRLEGLVASHIAAAIPNNELRLVYQPQISSYGGRVIGMEALLRWHSPELGILPAGRFMQMAEKLGLTVKMGEWAMREALVQARSWRDQGLDGFEIAINVSPIQLLRPEFVGEVVQAMQDHGISSQMVVLEVRQIALGQGMSQLQRTLAALDREGIRLTLDDFGIGDSNLDSLLRFSVEKIKVHRDFVLGVPGNSRQTAITCAIIAMGHQLGLKVVAQGVETEAQLDFLRRKHCDIFQGHLLGDPMDAEAAGVLLRRRFLRTDVFTALEGRTLLLLDDEENVLRSLVRLFRRDGYRVLTAKNVSEAFALLAMNDVQVILSDQRMSDMSGTEFFARVRARYPDTMRLLLSGHTDLATVSDAVGTGQIYRFLTKPWDDDTLRDHVRQAFVAFEDPLHERI